MVSGYLPANLNLIGDNYDVHDIRPLTWICDPADSILSVTEKSIFLISDKWPCRYSPQMMEKGALVLVVVDSTELHNAGIPVFENNSDQFGPAYVIATTEQCVNAFYPQIDNIETAIFNPQDQPVFSHFSNTPTYHISDNIEVKLPCRFNDPFTLAMTIPPQENLEIKIFKEGSSEFTFEWLTLGRSFIDRRSKRYKPQLDNDEYHYNVSAGVYGDLVQISPRCEGVDSFQVSIKMTTTNITDSCTLQTNYPFTIVESVDTITSIQSGSQYHLTIPISNEPITFISDIDELKELPDQNPQGDHKPYNVYDNFLFDLSIANQGACLQLNIDLNGGSVSSTTNLPSKQFVDHNECRMVSTQRGYTCRTHPHAEVVFLSDYHELGIHLPIQFDVAHCLEGRESSIVPAKF
ncbi:MAG: hypothetical protein AB8F78_11275 [Saprospiraceae bacterium]